MVRVTGGMVVIGTDEPLNKMVNNFCIDHKFAENNDSLWRLHTS